MDISEKWLGEIGGWAAMKAARSIVAAGGVVDVKRESDLVQGNVGTGKTRFRSGLRVRSRTDVDNLCTCPAGRRGMICDHSLAVALVSIAPAMPRGGMTKVEGRMTNAVQSSTSSVASRHAQPASKPSPRIEAPPGRFSIFLPDELAKGQRKPRTQIFLRFEPGGEERENALAQWLNTHGLKCQTMPVVLTDADLGVLLSVLAAHPRVSFGKPAQQPKRSDGSDSSGSSDLSISPEPTRLPVLVTENKNGSVQLSLQNKMLICLLPAPSSEASSWWLCTETRVLFRTERAPADLSPLLAELSVATKTRPAELSWLVRNIDSLESVFDLQFIGDTLTRLKILPVPCRFTLSLDGSPQFVEAELRAKHGASEWLVAPQIDRSLFPMADERDAHVFYTRDLARETSAVRLLEQAGFQPSAAGKWRLQGARSVLHFYGSIIPRLHDRFEIIEQDRWRSATRTWTRIAPAAKPIHDEDDRGAGRPSSDWLSLDIAYEASSGFSISRNEVMQMIRAGRSDVQDKQGRRYVLDTEACEDFEESLRDVNVQLTSEGARVRPEFAEYLTGRPLPTETPLSAADIRQKLGELGGRLRDYQAEGIAWLEQHGRTRRGALLADDMGLGKTLQTIATILLLRERSDDKRPVLILCPKSLIANWDAEIQKFAPVLKVASWVGADRKKDADASLKADVVLTTYQLVVRDEDILAATEFAAIVLDEASYIRNPDTESARALRRLRAPARFALTGTPVENSVRDLWSILQFLQPGYLGPRDVFRERFEKPIQDHPGSPEAIACSKRLRRLIKPWLLRRTKAEVLTELPEKIEQVLWCDLTAAQTSVYRRVLDEGLAEIKDARKRSGEGGARMTMFTVLLRLRQICCDLRLAGLPQQALDRLSADDLSGKLSPLEDRISEIVSCEGKVLVFSQFVQFLKLMRTQIEQQGISYSYLDGSTQDRAAAVKKFETDPACRVFFISLKAGGYGLNLTAANHVFLMDPWWNPAVEAQAIDRAHRMGQNRAVTAIRMVTRGTVEERILKLQAKKRGLIDALVEDGGAAAGLSADELEELIGQ